VKDGFKGNIISTSAKEIDHDFLWRSVKALPERGRIGIFNRSYYEEVLVCKVHSGIILNQRLPDVKSMEDVDDAFWEERYRSIRNHERHLAKNGTVIVKFFLHVSLEEQLKRLIDRIDTPRKNWKFNSGDFKERNHWKDYMEAYQTAIKETATAEAPWHVIPADNKPTMRAVVAKIVKETLESLSLEYPTLSGEEIEEMKEIRKSL
jgi:PPK2 family polyphosphate:nucleotide phosphotransferase